MTNMSVQNNKPALAPVRPPQASASRRDCDPGCSTNRHSRWTALGCVVLTPPGARRTDAGVRENWAADNTAWSADIP